MGLQAYGEEPKEKERSGKKERKKEGEIGGDPRGACHSRLSRDVIACTDCAV